MVHLCKKNCLEISFRGTVKSQRVQKSAKLLTEIKQDNIDHEQVDEKQQAVLRAKFKENLAKQEYQTEVEFRMEEEKGAEIKNQVQTAKISQQQRATTASKEVTRVQRQCQSVPQGEDGKQGHAQEASQANAVPEEYGPDAECQEVGRDEQELRTAQQLVKKMTQSQERRERHEYESDKTRPNEAILTTTDVEKSFFERNKEGGGQEAESIR